MLQKRTDRRVPDVRRILATVLVFLVVGQLIAVGVGSATTRPARPSAQAAESPGEPAPSAVRTSGPAVPTAASGEVPVSGSGVNATVAWYHNVTGESGTIYTKYAGGRVYAVSNESITALDADTGDRLGHYSFPFQAGTVPTLRLSTETVFVTWNGTAYGLDATTLDQQWAHTFDNPRNTVATPNYLVAQMDTSVNYTTAKYTLVAVEAATGDVAWRKTIYDNQTLGVFPDLGYDESVLFSYGDRFLALEPATGDVSWSSNHTADQWVAVDGTVHLVTEPSAWSGGTTDLVGLDESDGHVVFEHETSFDLDGQYLYQFEGGDGASYFVLSNTSTKTARVFEYDAGTGEKRSVHRFDQEVVASAASADSPYLVISPFTINLTDMQAISVIDTRTGDTGSLSFGGNDVFVRTFAGLSIENTTLYGGTTNGTVVAVSLAPAETQTISGAIAGSDNRIQIQELQQAIQYWANGEAVPETGGARLDISTLQELIRIWATGRTV